MKKLLTILGLLVIILFVGCSKPAPQFPDEMVGTYTQDRAGYNMDFYERPQWQSHYIEMHSTVTVRCDSIDAEIVHFEKSDVLYDTEDGTTKHLWGKGKAVFKSKESWLPTDTVYIFRMIEVTGDIPADYTENLKNSFSIWNSTRKETLWSLDFNRFETWYKQ